MNQVQILYFGDFVKLRGFTLDFPLWGVYIWGIGTSTYEPPTRHVTFIMPAKKGEHRERLFKFFCGYD